MARSTLKASEEVLGILNTAAVIGDDGVTLGQTLSRDEYQAVNKFLETAGAKWNRKAKRHLFTAPDARDKLLSLLETGEIRDDKKHFQAFYTPAELADELVELAEVQDGMDCLEPSAGDGVIADAIKEAGGQVLCVEIDPKAVRLLDKKLYVAYGADFLTCRPVEEEATTPESPGLGKFDRVVMNPPFTADQDIKHVRHAFKFLRDGGRLIAIMSPGFTFGEKRARREFRDFLEEHGRIVRELPEGTFKESGTNVRAVIVELVKE